MPRPTGHASVNFSQSRNSLRPPAERALMDSLEIHELAANVPLELPQLRISKFQNGVRPALLLASLLFTKNFLTKEFLGKITINVM